MLMRGTSFLARNSKLSRGAVLVRAGRNQALLTNRKQRYCQSFESCGLSSFCSPLSRRFSSSADSEKEQKPVLFNTQPETCYYETLGLSPSNSEEDIKKAFGLLVKKYHPDVDASQDTSKIFQAISEAYAVLGDPEKRALYDEVQGYKDSGLDGSFSEEWGHQAVIDGYIRAKAAEKRFSKTTPETFGDRNIRFTDTLKHNGQVLDPKEASILGGSSSLTSLKNSGKGHISTKPEISREEFTLYSKDGTKQDPEKLYSYFKDKYIKNPEMEVSDPEDQFAFTKKTYRKVANRQKETWGKYQYFESESRGPYYSPIAEENTEGTALSNAVLKAAPILTFFTAFGLFVYFNSTQKNPAVSRKGPQDEEGPFKSGKVTSGEGYKNKLVPI